MADGNAGQRARRFATTDARIDVGGVAQRRIEGHGDERVDDRVHALDLSDVRSRHLDGGNFTRLDEVREIDGVAPNDVVVHEGQYRFSEECCAPSRGKAKRSVAWGWSKPQPQTAMPRAMSDAIKGIAANNTSSATR